MKRYPGARGLLLRKTRVALTQSALVTFEEKVLSERERVELRVDQVTRQGRTEYVYPNGSRLIVGGLDNPLAAQSSEYDIIAGFEWIEVTAHEHEMATGLLRNGVMPFQQIIVDCNPGPPHHWLNARANSGLITRFLSRHADNPSITEARLDRLKRLTGVRRQRLYLGLWSAAEGVIYDGWDAAVHIVPRFDVPAGWRRWWIVDFGFTNPFVWIELVEDPDGRIYLQREIYHTRRIVSEHAKRILIATEGEPAPTDIVCDHDAEDRATLERALAEGVWVTGPVGQAEECAPGDDGARHLRLSKRTIPAHKSVRPGIEAVQERMKVADDGKPRFMIMAGCLVERDPSLDDPDSDTPPRPACTAEEIPTYVWDAGKDRPVKENDHGCLVAGTLVSTLAGARPIETIRAGDVVITRAGPRSVLAAGMTNPRAEVLEIEFDNGTTLTGTPDHPVWVAGSGWYRMDALRYNMAVEVIPCIQNSCPSMAMLSDGGLTGWSIADTQTQRADRTGDTFAPVRETAEREGRFSTATTTRTTMGRSLPGGMFTMWTATPSTTPLKTSWRFRRPFTTPITPSCIARWASETSRACLSRLAGICGTGQPSGTEARRAAPGIPSMADRWPQPGAKSPLRLSAPTVARPSRRGLTWPVMPNTAGMPVSPPRVGPLAPTTSSASVLSAGSSSLSIDTNPLGIVVGRARVVRVRRLAIRRPVYNLTVETDPEYFANGVLVHNCDCVRYGIARVDRIDLAGPRGKGKLKLAPAWQGAR